MLADIFEAADPFYHFKEKTQNLVEYIQLTDNLLYEIETSEEQVKT